MSEENTDIEETADTGKEEVEEPEENANEDGYVYYSDHGLSYSAMVFSGLGSSSYLELSLKDSVEYDLDEWQNDERYSDIEVSDILKNGSDRYQILTAKKENFYGTVYDITEVCYMDIREKASVFCGVW